MKIKTGVAILVSAVVLMSSVNKQDDKSFSKSSNQFGIDYANQAKEGNYFISPLSISTAMAMTYAGARGTTAEEFKRTMHFSKSANFHERSGTYLKALEANFTDVNWNLANRLWGYGPHPFEEKFLKVNATYYNAPLKFGASEGRINSWVEKQTNGKIQNLLPSGTITPDTRLILTNAVYFKGDWKYEFEEKRTKKKDFYSPNEKVKVEMMFQKGGFKYLETKDYQAIELPYKGEKQSMVILLPKTGIKKVEQALNQTEIMQLSKMPKANVNVHLPKFKMEYSEEFNEYLINKGMSTAFSENADFSGILTAEPIWIDQVIHKSFIEVAEQGTEAAAATAVVMTTESVVSEPPKNIEFNANKPCLYFIVDNVSESILFMGKLENPESE